MQERSIRYWGHLSCAERSVVPDAGGDGLLGGGPLVVFRQFFAQVQENQFYQRSGGSVSGLLVGALLGNSLIHWVIIWTASSSTSEVARGGI